MFRILVDYYDGGLGEIPISAGFIYTMAGIIFAITVALYLLRSIGVFTLAKKCQDDTIKQKAYFAWIPCLWIYLASRLAGKVLFFGKPMQKFALVMVILFTANEVLNIVYYVMAYLPLVGYYLQGGTVSFYMSSGLLTNAELASYGLKPYLFDSTFLTGFDINYPFANVSAMENVLFGISIVSDLLSLATLLFLVFFYIAIFKRYYPQHFVLATVLSIWLGIFPIFIFAIRNKKPVVYSEFVRERYNRMYNGNPYGNPNNPYNNPNNNPNGSGNAYNRPPETPFSDFAENGEVDPGNPFSEFDDKDKRDE